MSGFADRIFGYFAILQQMIGFADRIFGYFEIFLLQVQVPGTGTVSGYQYQYQYLGTSTTVYRTSTRYLYLLKRNLEISEYPVGESTHLLQNREICDIRIDYFLSEWCCESAKYPKISSRISAGALLNIN